MLKRYLPLFLVFIFSFQILSAQKNPSRNQSVMLEAEVSKDPANIQVNWPMDTSAGQWYVLKKPLGEKGWSNPTIQNADDTTYSDNNVNLGERYEYRVIKFRDGTARGTGLVNAGIEADAHHYRGQMALLIDSRLKNPVSASIQTLQDDLWGAGWQVTTLYIDSGAKVSSVKDTIRHLNNAFDSLRSLFLLGHIPVPYAGDFVNGGNIPRPPDGHTSRHGGAWPADLFYGELDGNWTDSNVTNRKSDFPRNYNEPGDGKLDQSFIQQVGSRVDLEVGRVDFSDLGAFQVSEMALYRRYLEKNHAFRHGEVNVANKGLIKDTFNSPAGFAQNGFRNFAPLLGRKSVNVGEYKNGLTNDSHLWSYGAGPGYYDSAEDIADTGDFVRDTFNGVFTMLFGSFFGDWDSKNNLMRSALASKGNLLNVAWAGRPNWHFHPMALGATIGYSTRITQNNVNINNQQPPYTQGGFAGGIHVALMGDPTLTMHNHTSPGELSHEVLTQVGGSGGHARLSWDSLRQADGYAVYRWDTSLKRYRKIHSGFLEDNTYTDKNPRKDTHSYMVRAMKRQSTPSGTYQAMSQGVFDTAGGLGPGTGSVTNLTKGHSGWEVTPNPTKGKTRIQLKAKKANGSGHLSITNLQGQTLKRLDLKSGQSDIDLDLSHFQKGVYLLNWVNQEQKLTKRLVVQ